MKKSFLTIGVVALLSGSLLLNSCIGSFALSNKVLDWNKTVGDKFINEVVFLALNIVPVYGITMLADFWVLNSIEFWTDTNPITKSGDVKEIKGQNADFQVMKTQNGYKITNEETNQSLDLTFDAENKTWNANNGSESIQILRLISDNTAEVYCGNNQTMKVELSQAGVMAFKQTVNSSNYVMK